MSRTVIGENGITPLKLAKNIQKEHPGLPLMVHIGSAPPDLADILSCLEKGDVLTHCFNGKENGILDRQSNTIKSFVLMLMAKVLLLILVMVQIVSIFRWQKKPMPPI